MNSLFLSGRQWSTRGGSFPGTIMAGPRATDLVFALELRFIGNTGIKRNMGVAKRDDTPYPAGRVSAQGSRGPNHHGHAHARTLRSLSGGPWSRDTSECPEGLLKPLWTHDAPCCHPRCPSDVPTPLRPSGRHWHSVPTAEVPQDRRPRASTPHRSAGTTLTA